MTNKSKAEFFLKLFFVSLFLLVTSLTFPSYSQSLVRAKFGKGVQVVAQDSSFSLKLGARFQTLYEGNLNLENDDWQEKLLIRRARLKFEGFAYHPSLEYKIQLGLSNRDIGGEDLKQNNYADNIILDAVLKWNFYRNFELWVGQTKLPGNRENLISSQKLQFVDRSALNSYFSIDRDIGIQLRHRFNVQKVVFKEMASIAKGEGRNVTANNAGGRNYTFRLEALPFGEFEGGGEYVGADLEREKKPKLALGITYDLNKGASRESGQSGDYLEAHRDLSTVFIDGIFKYRGSSFLFEYAYKTAPDGAVVAMDADNNVLQAFDTGSGINFQGGYLFKNDFEIAARYSQVTPEIETQKSDREAFTLALSKYIVGHSLKVQSDFSYVQEEGQDDNLRFRLQVEMSL